MLAVDGLTPATIANSVPVRAQPSSNRHNMCVRAGSAMAEATAEMRASASRTSMLLR
jgi:hypothetical protein